MDRSRYTVMKYLIDRKTHAAINSKLFRKLYHVHNAWYEFELNKTQVEPIERIVVRFLFLSMQKSACWNCTTIFSSKSVM